jgi:ParB family chromosome partitioning protein
MARKKGLGRGLDALLGAGAVAERTPAARPGHGLNELPVDLVRQGRYQPRVAFEEAALEELASSIRARGIVQPIVVRPSGDGVHYEIVAGERRWRAAQLAGLDRIPAVVRDVPDEDALALALIENVQREDLNPIEEAAALRRLIDEFSLTHQEAAEAVGRSRVAASNLVRLLDLEPDVRAMLEDGRLEMGHGRALLALEGPRQREAAAQSARRGLSVRETEALVRRLTVAGDRARHPARPVDPDVRHLETSVSELLGARVSIKQGRRGKGRLSIDYDSLEQLDGILERLGHEHE